jgi:hypothetical protein
LFAIIKKFGKFSFCFRLFGLAWEIASSKLDALGKKEEWRDLLACECHCISTYSLVE